MHSRSSSIVCERARLARRLHELSRGHRVLRATGSRSTRTRDRERPLFHRTGTRGLTSAAAAAAATTTSPRPMPSSSPMTCMHCEQVVLVSDFRTHKCTKVCADCGKTVTLPNRRAHKCYRRRRGLKLFVCRHCSADFATSRGLADHLRCYGDEPHDSIFVPTYELSPEELNSSERFSGHEPVLSQRLIHSTHPQTVRAILDEQRLRGGSATTYDTVLFTDPSAPPSLFTELRPASDGHMFAYSFYPVDIPLLEDVAMFTLHMGFLAAPEYRMFFHKSSSTQFGKRFRFVALSQVVFARTSDAEALDFACRNFIELDKRANGIVRFSDADGGWTLATRFRDGENIQRPHKVNIVILGGLRLTEDMDVKVIEGKRAGSVNQKFPCPECEYHAPSVFMLKTHMQRFHTAVPSYSCSFDGCGYTGWTRRGLTAHEKLHTDTATYSCGHVGCAFATRRKSDLRPHIFSAHCAINPYVCSRDGCVYSSGSQKLLLQHHRHARHRFQ